MSRRRTGSHYDAVPVFSERSITEVRKRGDYARRREHFLHLSLTPSIEMQGRKEVGLLRRQPEHTPGPFLAWDFRKQRLAPSQRFGVFLREQKVLHGATHQVQRSASVKWCMRLPQPLVLDIDVPKKRR